MTSVNVFSSLTIPPIPGGGAHHNACSNTICNLMFFTQSINKKTIIFFVPPQGDREVKNFPLCKNYFFIAGDSPIPFQKRSLPMRPLIYSRTRF